MGFAKASSQTLTSTAGRLRQDVYSCGRYLFHKLVHRSRGVEPAQHSLDVTIYEPSSWCNKRPVLEYFVSHHVDSVFHTHDPGQTFTDEVIEMSSLDLPHQGTVNNNLHNKAGFQPVSKGLAENHGIIVAILLAIF